MSKLWGTTWRHTVGPTSDPDPTSGRGTTLDLDPIQEDQDAFQEDQDAFQEDRDAFQEDQDAFQEDQDAFQLRLFACFT